MKKLLAKMAKVLQTVFRSIAKTVGGVLRALFGGNDLMTEVLAAPEIEELEIEAGEELDLAYEDPNKVMERLSPQQRMAMGLTAQDVKDYLKDPLAPGASLKLPSNVRSWCQKLDSEAQASVMKADTKELQKHLEGVITLDGIPVVSERDFFLLHFKEDLAAGLDLRPDKHHLTYTNGRRVRPQENRVAEDAPQQIGARMKTVDQLAKEHGPASEAQKIVEMRKRLTERREDRERRAAQAPALKPKARLRKSWGDSALEMALIYAASPTRH